jgi:hypothetical protein
MKIFSGFWLKVSAIFAAIAGVFFMIIRYQSNKIEDLEHENKTVTKKAEITQEQAEFAQDVMASEYENALAEVSKNETKSKYDRLNDI